MEQLQPSTIVVVEDEKITRLAIINILRNEGFNVMGAEDGADALRILKTANIDLVLADIRMPIMDGVALYRSVQEDQKLREIPFIFLTNLTDQEHKIFGKELGVDDYLTKPVERELLLASISGKLKRAASLRASRIQEIENLRKEILKSLSDEVKAPINIVRNLSTLLLDQRDKISSDQMVDLLKSIKAGGDRLQRGLDDFVMTPQIESGAVAQQYEAEKGQHDLLKLVAKIMSQTPLISNAKSVQVIWNPPNESRSVVAAGKQLEQMLERLVYTAVALSNPNSKVEISAEVGEREVLLMIKTSGAGISKAELPHVFDKFRAIRHPSADEYPIGLSLYTAKRLAEINKCDLTCLSQPGKGTTFMLTIPSS